MSFASKSHVLRLESKVNDYFQGHMLMMHRPQTPNAPDSPYADYFTKKTRRWELRLQGGTSDLELMN